jgi:hypothetical protein
MEYKPNYYGVTFDVNLSEQEIYSVHTLWKNIMLENPYNGEINWNKFKNNIGLKFDRQETPNWTIISKERWLWAKLKYGI